MISSYLSRYYMRDFDSPDEFAKILANLNISKCSKEVILNFVRHAEKYFLTSTVISLYTKLFERSDVSKVDVLGYRMLLASRCCSPSMSYTGGRARKEKERT